MSNIKEERKMKKTTAIDNKCPSCGGKMDFQPKLGKWKCDYCDSEFTIEQLKEQLKKTSQIEKNEEGLEEDDSNLFQYNCPDCGAIIVADEHTTATFCVYCGNTAILKNKLTGKFHPNSLIPFKIEKKEAITAFKEISKGRMFVPKDFNSETNIEKIRGIYIPFWLYDINFTGEFDAKGNKITNWRVGRTHFTKTDTYSIHRKGTMFFNKVPVDGSTRFDNDLMNSIEPFDYKDLVEYNHAYLSGFLAEKYDIDKDECYKDAKKRIVNSGEKELLKTCRYTVTKIQSKNYQDVTANFYYVLLPVYMVNVKYHNQLYTFAMNGQTGKFVGNIPLDKKKVAIVSIITPIILFIIIEIIIYIIYMVGGA